METNMQQQYSGSSKNMALQNSMSNGYSQGITANPNTSSPYKNKYHHSPSPFRSKNQRISLLAAHQNNYNRMQMQQSSYLQQQNQNQSTTSVYQALAKQRQNGGGFTSQGPRIQQRKSITKNTNAGMLGHTQLINGNPNFINERNLAGSMSPDKRYKMTSQISRMEDDNYLIDNKFQGLNVPNFQGEEKKYQSSNNLNLYANLENCKQDQKNQSNVQKSGPKEVIYAKPGVKIGDGKFHQIDLIIYNNELSALKKIPKASIDKAKRIEHLKNEKKINYFLKDAFSKQNVKWFVSLEQTFTDQDSINYIFEYLPGSDLFWVIQNEMNLFLGKQKSTGSTRDWIKFYAAEVLVALEILHNFNIIYRDLKPENVMIDKDGHIKLIDFGFAKMLSVKSKNRTVTNCGTLGYSAPEVLMGLGQGYSFSADIWSFGILLCELIQGSLPFENKDDPQMIENQIIKGEYKIPRDADQTARDLISQILVLEPNLRLSIQDIKQHKFFADIDWDKVSEKKLDPVPYKPNPLKYKYLLQNKYPQISNLKGVLINEDSDDSQQKQASPVKSESPKRNVLGDFTLYKINKEFENF